MYGEETAERQYSKYSEKKTSESEYDKDTETLKWESSKRRKKKSLVEDNNPMYCRRGSDNWEVGLGRHSDARPARPGWK